MEKHFSGFQDVTAHANQIDSTGETSKGFQVNTKGAKSTECFQLLSSLEDMSIGTDCQYD